MQFTLKLGTSMYLCINTTMSYTGVVIIVNFAMCYVHLYNVDSRMFVGILQILLFDNPIGYDHAKIFNTMLSCVSVSESVAVALCVSG